MYHWFNDPISKEKNCRIILWATFLLEKKSDPTLWSGWPETPQSVRSDLGSDTLESHFLNFHFLKIANPKKNQTKHSQSVGSDLGSDTLKGVAKDPSKCQIRPLWTLIFEFSFSQTRKKSNQTFLTVSDPTSDLTLWQVWLETPQSVRPPCYYTYYPAAPQQKRLGFKVPKRLGFRIPKSCFFNNVFCIDLQNIKTEDNPSAKSLMNATAERSRSSQINSRIYHDS